MLILDHVNVFIIAFIEVFFPGIFFFIGYDILVFLLKLTDHPLILFFFLAEMIDILLKPMLTDQSAFVEENDKNKKEKPGKNVAV